MRNLKKFLALVLAFVMAMSLMVTVNAASSDFVDSEDVNEKFEEAVEVLSSLGVFQGTNEDGALEFKPQSSVTRAQMAAVVYRLATGDTEDARAHLYKEYQSFSDVSSDAWYAGYVGFCADAEIIKGYTDGTFKPSKAVTGYEALAMLLRAVGYGQNGEFEGSGWTVRVGSTATGEGLLKNVNTSSYAGTLNETAKREMLAEISFQAALVPTVQYQYGTYNKYTNLVSGVYNDSLAERFFGLTSLTGIIVGNQATGETSTKVGFSLTSDGNGITDNGSYIYTTDADGYDNITLEFDTETGLNLFGHKVKIWYNYKTNANTEVVHTGADAKSYRTGFGTVYLVKDLATKVEVLHIGDMVESSNLALTANTNKLYKAAADNDFTIGKDSGGDNKAWFSGANTAGNTFTQMAVANYATTFAVDTLAPTMVMLISNSATDSNGKNQLDLVVPMVVTVEEVSKVNNYNDPKTVTVTKGADANADGYGDTATVIGVNKASGNKKLIAGAGTYSVGDAVVVNAIYGTADTTNTKYVLNTISKETNGVIRGIGGNGKVTLADGSTLEKSPLFDLTITTENVIRPASLVIGGSYTFQLDKDGKYAGAYPASATTLLGAYAYWQQEGIDGIKYYIQGVTKKGVIETHEITAATYNSGALAKQEADEIDIHTMISGNHDASSGTGVYIANPGANAKGLGGYRVYGISAANALSGTTLDTATPANSTSWNKNVITGETWNAKTTTVAGTGNYLTKDTEYHVITGWGNTLKVEHFTGMEALLQGANSVNVKGWFFVQDDDSEHAVTGNTAVTDVLVVDASWVKPVNYLYNKDAQTIANEPASADSNAHQLMMYVAGEGTTSGILVAGIADEDDGTYDETDSAENVFYKWTLDDDGYYKLVEIANSTSGTPTEALYSESANGLINENTAFGDIKFEDTETSAVTHTLHAANAIVIDVTGTDHGITNYETLRRAAEENKIVVSVLLTEAGGDTASVIYVTAVTAR